MSETLIGGKNKTQIVREILEQMGFMQEQVPANWKVRVQNALEKQRVSVHETVIYQTRKRQIEAQNIEKAKAEQARLAALPPVVESPVVPVAPPPVKSLTLADAAEIKAMAKRFGGFKGLTEAVQAVEAFAAE